MIIPPIARNSCWNAISVIKRGRMSIIVYSNGILKAIAKANINNNTTNNEKKGLPVTLSVRASSIAKVT